MFSLCRTASNLPRKWKYTPVSATLSKPQAEMDENDSQSQVLNVNAPEGPAQVSTGLQPGTLGVVAVEVVESDKELAITPKPKAKASKKIDQRNELHSKIFQFLERESEHETITEAPEHHVDLQLKSIGLQIKEALDADEQCRLLYRVLF